MGVVAMVTDNKLVAVHPWLMLFCMEGCNQHSPTSSNNYNSDYISQARGQAARPHAACSTMIKMSVMLTV